MREEGIAHYNSHYSGGCCIEWMMESMQAAGAESREIEMEEDAMSYYQQATNDQQAEAPNFLPVKMKEDEENPWPHLSKQFAFQRGNSYMLCKLCLIRQSELSAYTNSSSNLRKHVLVSTVFVPFHLVVQTAFLSFS